MKNAKQLIYISILILAVIFFVVLNMYISKNKIDNKGEYPTDIEFVKTIDCAPIFDMDPMGTYKISFYAKGTKDGTIRVYQQNGSSSKYYFSEIISVTTEYQFYELVVQPSISHQDEEESYLAFYGEYGTQQYPAIKEIKIEKL